MNLEIKEGRYVIAHADEASMACAKLFLMRFPSKSADMFRRSLLATTPCP